MSHSEFAIERPQRWDVPFDEAMTASDVEHLLQVEPFRSMDPGKFPPTCPLAGILQHDTRLRYFKHGDLVVREGDYGHSAFMVLHGRLRVTLDSLPPEFLGRQPPEKKGLLTALAQLFNGHKSPEVRHISRPQESSAAAYGTREEADGTHVFLQDVPRLLSETGTVVLERGEVFGELAALSRTPRTATVFAESDDVILLEMRWQGLREFMKRDDAWRQHIESRYRENSLRVHLRETPLLENLTPESLDAIAAATQFESHGDFEWHTTYEATVQRDPADRVVSEPLILEEGRAVDSLYLIRSGFARLSCRHGHGHQTVAYLGKGQVYGMAELAHEFRTSQSIPAAYSLRAIGYVDILRVPRTLVFQHVLPNVDPQLLPRLSSPSVAGEETDPSTSVGTNGLPASK